MGLKTVVIIVVENGSF